MNQIYFCKVCCTLQALHNIYPKRISHIRCRNNPPATASPVAPVVSPAPIYREIELTLIDRPWYFWGLCFFVRKGILDWEERWFDWMKRIFGRSEISLRIERYHVDFCWGIMVREKDNVDGMFFPCNQTDRKMCILYGVLIYFNPNIWFWPLYF